MKKLESLFGIIAAAGFLGTAGLAIMALGVLLFKGPAGSDAVMADISAAQVQAPVAETAAEAPATDTTTAEAPAPVAVAAINPEQGEKVFKKCKACHTVDEGGKHTTGPNLWSIVGRQVATADGFSYSDDMAAMGDKVWDAALLDTYLTKPKALVPGTKMAFAGLKKEADRQNVITYLAQLSATPQSAAELGFAAAAVAAVTSDGAADAPAAEEVAFEPYPYPDGITYQNPPARSAEETAKVAEKVAALEALLPELDYERARFHPIHFPPMIAEASNEECLVCHQEILDHTPREASPAGVAATDTLAWYQTLDTYTGDQASFHYRHLESDFAKQVMQLDCVFCHKGNDPREESPDMMPTRAAFSAAPSPEFTLRKMVNPSETCLRCHGAMPDPVEIMALSGPWHEVRDDFEDDETPNGCLSCHAELYRLNRHNVTYLNAAGIEEAARDGTDDTCYGCHGGRAWYRTSYPYPRHAWPDMDEETPDWALNRPTESDPEYALPQAAAE